MRRTLFIILSIALLLTLAICPIASADTTTPTLERVIPSPDTYLDLSMPIATAADGDILCVVHVDEEAIPSRYILLAFDNGEQIQTLDTGLDKPTDIAVYEEYVIVFYKDKAITAYNLETAQPVDFSEIPANPANFALDDDFLYVQYGATIDVFSLENIENDEIVKVSTAPFAPYNFMPTSFTVTNDIIYYDVKVESDLTHPEPYYSIYAYDTTADAPTSTLVASNIESPILKLASNEAYLYALLYKADNNILSAYKFSAQSNAITVPLKTKGPTSISTNGIYLYVTHMTEETIDVYNQSLGFERIKSICTNSDAPGRFNYPDSVYAKGDVILVSDNPIDPRIQIFDANTLEYERYRHGMFDLSEVECIGNSTVQYALLNRKLHGENVSFFYTFPGSSEIELRGTTRSLVMDKDGTIYAINTIGSSSSVIYKTKTASTFSTLSIDAPIAISKSSHGSILYAVYSNKIVAYDKEYKQVFATSVSSLLNGSTFDKSLVKDVDSDADGNMFIIYDMSLIVLNRTWNGFTYRGTYPLTIDGKETVVESISISDKGEVYLTGGLEHCVYRLKNSGAAKYNAKDFSIPNFEQNTPISEAAKFVKVKVDNAFIYDYSATYESVRSVPKDTTLLLLSNQPSYNMYFVYYDGKPGYLHKDFCNVYQAAINKYAGIALYNAPLYKYPLAEESLKITTIPKDTKFYVLSDVFGYEHNDGTNRSYWYQIEYNDSIYYIQRNNVGEASIETAKDFGTAKLRASVINTKVTLYYSADITSKVLGTYDDGTDVKLLEELNRENEFTKVSIDGLNGYVLTADLTTGGMTTAQIILLVIIILGGAASVAILVISRKMYRKR